MYSDIVRGLYEPLILKLEGVLLASIEQIDFVFKQDASETAPALKTATYKSDGTGDVITGQAANTLIVPFTPEDTRKFNGQFYMFGRVTLTDSIYNPKTYIQTLTMGDTLFAEGDDND